MINKVNYTECTCDACGKKEITPRESFSVIPPGWTTIHFGNHKSFDICQGCTKELSSMTEKFCEDKKEAASKAATDKPTNQKFSDVDTSGRKFVMCHCNYPDEVAKNYEWLIEELVEYDVIITNESKVLRTLTTPEVLVIFVGPGDDVNDYWIPDLHFNEVESVFNYILVKEGIVEPTKVNGKYHVYFKSSPYELNNHVMSDMCDVLTEIYELNVARKGSSWFDTPAVRVKGLVHPEDKLEYLLFTDDTDLINFILDVENSFKKEETHE